MTEGALPPVQFYADLGALIDLRDSIAAIREDLQLSKLSSLGTDAFTMGGVDVADGVNAFVNNWRDGRTKIDDGLSACAALLDQAIRTYQEAEQAIVQATRSPAA